MPVAFKTKPPEVQSIANDPADIDFRVVPTDDIEPNDYNPNDMEEAYFEALTAAIQQDGGMHQPILVRPNPDKPGKFLIVDGENRWRGMAYLKKPKTPVVVVPFSESMARVRTLSMNNLRGQNIPIKLARLLVDLYKEYSPEDVRAMTGIVEDDQKSVLQLLQVPDFNPASSIKITSTDVERPVQINLMLMPVEKLHYTEAMRKAMKLAGPDVTALLGHECSDYDKAMKASMGIAGVKLRNVALALICSTFNGLSADQQKAAMKEAHTKIYDKLAQDAAAKEAKKEASDKKLAG